MRERAQHVRKAVKLLHAMDLDFECDGEMSVDVALNAELLAVSRDDPYFPDPDPLVDA